MKIGTKLGNSQKKSRGLTAKHKSFSYTTENCQSHVRNVGLRADASEDRSNTLLYDVYTCPLSVYIDITVDDKLENLIISGNPTREELEDAKMKIVSEFSELSGGGEMKALSDVTRSYYAQRSVMTGIEMCMKLISAGRFEKAVEFLNNHGVKCSVPANDDELDALIKAVELKYKNKLAKFKEISGRYKEFAKKGEKPTRQYYNQLLIMLSTCEIIKIQLNPKKLTVAEFAEYINIFNEYQNHLKIKKYGRYNR